MTDTVTESTQRGLSNQPPLFLAHRCHRRSRVLRAPDAPPMTGKRAAIFGVANDHSIAWAIAQRFHAEGAELALTYPNEAIEKRVRPLAESIGVDLVLPCDVTDDAQIEAVFAALARALGRRPRRGRALARLRGARRSQGPLRRHLARRASTSRSTSAPTRWSRWRARAEPLLAARRGSLVTMTYFGAEKVIPHYNVMGVAKAALETCVRYLAVDLGPTGIRVNAISAGPLRTLSSAGISRLQDDAAPPRGARAAAPQRHRRGSRRRGAVSLQRRRSGVTGEVLHVDGGYNVMGM